MILNTALLWQQNNINPTLNPKKTPISHPQASYRVSFARIWEKIDGAFIALHCTLIQSLAMNEEQDISTDESVYVLHISVKTNHKVSESFWKNDIGPTHGIISVKDNSSQSVIISKKIWRIGKAELGLVFLEKDLWRCGALFGDPAFGLWVMLLSQSKFVNIGLSCAFWIMKIGPVISEICSR